MGIQELLGGFSSQADAELKDGDILFRWVPRGIGQRDLVQALISGGQVWQMTTQEGAGLGPSGTEFSAVVVEHVGIYTSGIVIEIGKKGLERNPVEDRKNYDLVVRSSVHGGRIATLAREARPDRRQSICYPAWDILNLACKPTLGYGGAGPVMNRLINEDRLNHNGGRANTLKQAVVCSHFVHAVLYAAATGGTLRTATDHAWDRIFKISPSHMWTEFLTNGGIWGQVGAVYMGLQHRGKLNRTIDPRRLGVGLKMPPVPTTAGRPPLRALTGV